MTAQISSIDTWNPEIPPGDDQYLESLLHWLHRLLTWQVAATRQAYGELADDEYRGLYVPDGEVEILSGPPPSLPDDLSLRRLALEDERQRIEERSDSASRSDGQSPLASMGRLFGLSRFERDVLLLGLAPELDLRYERLYAYVQDDVTRKRPSIDLALRLLVRDRSERVRARASFDPAAPLMRHQLIEILDDGQRQAVLISRVIKVDDAIVAELLGHTAIDPQISRYVSI